MRDRVGGGIGGGCDAFQRCDVERLRDTRAAGRDGCHVRDRVAAAEPHQCVEADRDRVGGQKDGHHAEAGDPADELGEEDAGEVCTRPHENAATLLCVVPPADDPRPDPSRQER